MKANSYKFPEIYYLHVLEGLIIPEQFCKLEDRNQFGSLIALKCFHHIFLYIAPNKIKLVAYESRLEELSNTIWFVKNRQVLREDGPFEFD